MNYISKVDVEQSYLVYMYYYKSSAYETSYMSSLI